MRKLIAFIFAICLLLPSLGGIAKGNFDYITVKGPGIIEDITITDPVLTSDYFAFADFSQGAIDAPPNPGEGYEIVRLYLESKESKPNPVAFDLLYYFPYTGYVYYDGIVDGSSEYDGKWYPANPSANEPFRAVLTKRARLTWLPFIGLLIILVIFFIAYYKKPQTV